MTTPAYKTPRMDSYDIDDFVSDEVLASCSCDTAALVDETIHPLLRVEPWDFPEA